jgi:hypothetical protein
MLPESGEGTKPMRAAFLSRLGFHRDAGISANENCAMSFRHVAQFLEHGAHDIFVAPIQNWAAREIKVRASQWQTLFENQTRRF